MKQLSSFLFGHIPPNQFGFLPGTGTVDVGVILADTISLALEARKDVRLAALDFKGAFDKRCGGGVCLLICGRWVCAPRPSS